MTEKVKVPIIIGVGEVKNPSRRKEDAIEPLDLMLSSIQNAAQDAVAKPTDLISQINGVSVVASSTWPYQNLPEIISQRLGVKPSHMAYSELTGNSSVQKIDDTAQQIARGDIDVGLVVGGEAFASLKDFIKSGTYPPPWTARDQRVDNVYYANDTDMLEGIGGTHGIGVPMQVYPLYENGLRAHQGQTIRANHEESAKLYAKYAHVASNNPMAWNYGGKPETETSIRTITKRNRMICFPYPLLMNAFNDVNLAAACILTSTECAERLGIPEEKWIYPLGGGRANDTTDFWNRRDFYSSPAIATALDMALQSSKLSVDNIDIFDFYSCFPIVPKLACRHLGIPLLESPKSITLLGGLTSFGGAGANYSMHAIAEMVRQLRSQHKDHPVNGLVLANGGVLTHENAICLSTSAPPTGRHYPQSDCLDSNQRNNAAPLVATTAEGEAILETYTVEYDRDNNPVLGHVVCRLAKSDARVIANHADDNTLKQLASCHEEPIGKVGYVRKSDRTKGQNIFSFQREHTL